MVYGREKSPLRALRRVARVPVRLCVCQCVSPARESHATRPHAPSPSLRSSHRAVPHMHNPQTVSDTGTAEARACAQLSHTSSASRGHISTSHASKRARSTLPRSRVSPPLRPLTPSVPHKSQESRHLRLSDRHLFDTTRQQAERRASHQPHTARTPSSLTSFPAPITTQYDLDHRLWSIR